MQWETDGEKTRFGFDDRDEYLYLGPEFRPHVSWVVRFRMTFNDWFGEYPTMPSWPVQANCIPDIQRAMAEQVGADQLASGCTLHDNRLKQETINKASAQLLELMGGE